MLNRLLLCLLLLPGIANAQFVDGHVLTASQLNNAFANTLPISGGTLTGPLVAPNVTITGGTITGLYSPVPLASGGTGATSATGALTALGGAPLASPTFTGPVTANGILVPDAFIQSGDAGNDSLSIQRAINALCANPGSGGGKLLLLSRHYSIQSAITQSCHVLVQGQGWPEGPYPLSSISQAGGTWLDIAGSGYTPWTLSTAGAAGSEFRDLAVAQPSQPQPVITTFTGSISGTTLTVTAVAAGTVSIGQSVYGSGFGNNVAITALGTGTGGVGTYTVSTSATATSQTMTAMTAWTPLAYPYVFNANGVLGQVGFHHIMMDGVYQGINFTNSGRIIIDGLYGQWFSSILNVDQSMDVNRITDIHAWPYFTAAGAVMAWQQANSNAIVLNRADGPFINNVFFYAAKSGIQLNNSGSGTTTGMAIGTISCDSVQWCLDVEATGTSGQVSNLRQYGQQGTASNVPLSGSSAINFGASGQGSFQISNIAALAVDASVVTVNNSNSTGCSTLAVGSLFSNFSISTSPSVSYLSAPAACGSGQSQMLISTLPQTILNSGIGQTVSTVSGSGAVVYLNAITNNPVFTGTGVVTDATNGNATWTLTNTAGNGAGLKLTGNGSTTPSKTIRVQSGVLQFVNNAYSSVIASLSDSGQFNAVGGIQSNGTTLNPVLTGTSGSIGGSALAAGACTSGTVAVSGSTTSMAVATSPATYPGEGIFWHGYVSSAGTVTVKVCASVAATPTASNYNVRVLQ
jgi:hypothetical protein